MNKSLFCFLLFFVFMVVPNVCYGQEKKEAAPSSAKSYRAEVGTCKTARPQDEGDAPHIFFPVSDGRDMWKEIALGRVGLQELEAIKKKMELEQQNTKLWRDQFDAANKTVDAQGKVITDLRARVTQQEASLAALQERNNGLVLEVAKHKGEKYTYLFWGVVGGAATMLVVGVAVAIYVAVTPKVALVAK